jgi:hypothetical protein
MFLVDFVSRSPGTGTKGPYQFHRPLRPGICESPCNAHLRQSICICFAPGRFYPGAPLQQGHLNPKAAVTWTDCPRIETDGPSVDEIGRSAYGIALSADVEFYPRGSNRFEDSRVQKRARALSNCSNPDPYT